MAQDNVDVIAVRVTPSARATSRRRVDCDPDGRDRRAGVAALGRDLPRPGGVARRSLASIVGHFDEFKAMPEKVLGADDNHVIVVAKNTGRTKGGERVEGQPRLDLPAARRRDHRRRGLHRHRRGSSKRSDSRAPASALSVVIVTHDSREALAALAAALARAARAKATS